MPLVDDDDSEPRCEICGRLEEDSPAGFADADWNPETGNHETCEQDRDATFRESQPEFTGQFR